MIAEDPQYNLDAKKEVVNEFKELVNEYDVVAAVNVEGLPAKQLSEMRANLRGNAVVRVGKKTLMGRALEAEGEKGIMELTENFRGMPALLFTNENPFSLFQRLKETKTPAPIKAGQEAPKDIVIPEGPTDFAPGPIIGELGNFGVKAGIEGGKVAVKNDTVVAKEGETVGEDLAGILGRLGIQPMEIGLNITAAYQDGDILTRTTLDIDVDEYKATIQSAASNAFRLSIAEGILNADTATHLVRDAHIEALKLAKQEAIINEDTLDELLAQANTQATTLHTQTQEE